MTKQTNIEFITHLMDFAKTGPMMQLFVLEGVRKYAEQISADPDKVRDQMKDHMIHPESWIASAREALDSIETHLGK